MSVNRLAGEKSPYLLQHARNPVDWYPWGAEAFAAALRQDKPIFLSVGYSTCHWCHVMERESFESEAIAEVINRHFIPVKVDREERPDLDRIYMNFLQAFIGAGGWPMSVWLTPELRPFFAGTYYPPDQFLGVLERVAEAWQRDHGRIAETSQDLLAQLNQYANPAPAGEPGEALLADGFAAIRRGFDSRHGGFGTAPKFPRPVTLNFLLRYYKRTGEREALEMVLATLRAMARGGIRDHVGGGFHRYSVDDRWFVPHFEKMLYDQAQLAVTYLEACQASGDEFFAGVARETLEYVLRDLGHPEGGFYSAEDADSATDAARPEKKGEGAYYLWSRAEIEKILPPEDAARFCERYGVAAGGNVADDPRGEFTGRNILHAAGEPAERVALETLRQARYQRPRPLLDDKILTAWNGLAISAFAKAAQVWEEGRYLVAAQRAADFILDTLWQPEAGLLLRRFRDGEAAIPGFLDDYAFLAQGLLDLFEACFEPGRLDAALALTEAMLERFEDRENGGFYSTEDGNQELLMRLKDHYDGAEPSGNSIATLNLLRLAEITGRADLRESAERVLRVFAAPMAAQPDGVPLMLAAFARRCTPQKLIVVVGRKDAADTRALLRALHRRFVPDKSVLLVEDAEGRRRLGAYLPEVSAMPESAGATAYVCENRACRLPVSSAEELAALL